MLQLLAAKLFETWVMLTKRFLQSNPPDVVAHLEPAHQASLQWLTDYFGNGQPFKDSALKIIRDKTAVHYDRLNLTEAADNLAAGENSLYLAQHPAGSLYYMGSALVFRAIFAMIADKADGAANGSHEERVHRGTKIAIAYGDLPRDAPPDDRRNAAEAFRRIGAGLVSRYYAPYPWAIWTCGFVLRWWQWDIHSAGNLLISIGNGTQAAGFSWANSSPLVALIRQNLRLPSPEASAIERALEENAAKPAPLSQIAP
jgi:hypothetical protein